MTASRPSLSNCIDLRTLFLSDSKSEVKKIAPLSVEKLLTTMSKGASIYLASHDQHTDDAFRAQVIHKLTMFYQESDKANSDVQDFLRDLILYVFLAIKNIKDSALFFDTETSLVSALRAAATANSFELPEDDVALDMLKQSVFYKDTEKTFKDIFINCKIKVIKNELLSQRSPHFITHPEILSDISSQAESYEVNAIIDKVAGGKRSSERVLLDIMASVLLEKFMLVDKVGNLKLFPSLIGYLTYYNNCENSVNINLKESGYRQEFEDSALHAVLIHGMKKLIKTLKTMNSSKVNSLSLLYDALIKDKPQAVLDTLLFLCEAIEQDYLGKDYFTDFRITIREVLGLLSNTNLKIESAFYSIIGDMIPFATPMKNDSSGFSYALMLKQPFNMEAIINQPASKEQEQRLHLLLSAMKFAIIRCLPNHLERSRQIKSLLNYMKDAMVDYTRTSSKAQDAKINWTPSLYPVASQQMKPKEALSTAGNAIGCILNSVPKDDPRYNYIKDIQDEISELHSSFDEKQTPVHKF